MYRQRCREKYSDAELAEIYANPWGMQDDWEDHRRRLETTQRLATSLLHTDESIRTAADLSCGDAHWSNIFPELSWTLGDYASGFELCGPIEDTVEGITPVDIFFLCETLEHLDDPDDLLMKIRQKTRYLILSTPKKFEFDENPEHYYAWDDDAVREMLVQANFTPIVYQEANGWHDNHVNGYVFQVWSCK